MTVQHLVKALIKGKIENAFASRGRWTRKSRLRGSVPSNAIHPFRNNPGINGRQDFAGKVIRNGLLGVTDVMTPVIGQG